MKSSRVFDKNDTSIKTILRLTLAFCSVVRLPSVRLPPSLFHDKIIFMNRLSNKIVPENLSDEFNTIYDDGKNPVRVFAAPARINIIGEHIDYNGGKVFPAAIDRFLYIAIRKRNDSRISYRDVKFPGVYGFDIRDEFAYKKENGYANYLNGIVTILKRRGSVFSGGFDALIASDIPPAGGISSSSALECAFAYALSEVFDFGISRKDIALAGQQSEHEFMNVNCGIMDQFIIATAKKDTAELLDCATLGFDYVPLALGDYRFVVMNTQKKRKLADSKYNERRAECELALAVLQAAKIPLHTAGKYTNTKDIPELCALTAKQLDECKNVFADETIFRRARHCVTENERVAKAACALKDGNLCALGTLLKESHASLKDDYEVTGIELDTLADAANAEHACIGARMTGAGFGGCAIALIKNDGEKEFIDNVQRTYVKTIGYEAAFFTCTSADGVREIKTARR